MDKEISIPKGHPRGLYYLFSTEMWERFSYYGIMSILILFATKALGFNDAQAGILAGSYSAFTWLSPLLGGWLADKFIGQVNAVKYGAMMILAGNVILLVDKTLPLMYFGFAVIVVGTGLLKSSVSVLVGQLYDDGDPRIDRAYTIFFMGINIGSIGAVFVGIVAEKVGWHAGFALSAGGMAIGLIIYLLGMKHLRLAENHFATAGIGKNKLVVYGSLIASVALVTVLFLFQNIAVFLMAMLTIIVIVALFKYYLQYRHDKLYKYSIPAIAIYVGFSAIFCVLYGQMFDSLVLFIDRVIDKSFFGFELPTTFIVNFCEPFFVIIQAPLLDKLWAYLEKRGKEPSTPVKFTISLFVMGTSFLIFAYQALMAVGGVRGSLLIMAVAFFVFANLDIMQSVVGFSMVRQLAPKELSGFMMGMFFFSISFGSFVSGLLTARFGVDADKVNDVGECARQYYHLFGICGITLVITGLLTLLVIKKLKKAHELAYQHQERQ